MPPRLKTAPLVRTLIRRAALEALEVRQLLANSIYAYPAADGHMIYKPQPLGDHIEDFSNAGYKGGTVAIPDVPVMATVSPVAGDDTSTIQAAINAVSTLTIDPNTGFRGAVLLNPGTYEIGTNLRITASGVVLRGSGPNQTILHATGTGQREIIQVDGSGTRSTVSGTTHNISDKYVPVGAISFTVNSTTNLHVGDSVVIHRPSTQQWINDMGMNLLDMPWTPGSKDINMDRTITHIDGSVITVDAPITQALDLKYTDASQGTNTIYAYTANGRLSNVGVEYLSGYSDYNPAVTDPSDGFIDEDHPWTFIHVDGSINAWVRGISSQYFGYSAVYVTGNSKWLTVEDSQCLDPVSQITGGRRYSFNLDDSSNVLFRNNYTREGRHDFVEGSTVVGPDVFLDSRADNTHADAGPHHRYSTAALWDNIRSGQINIQDRGNSGTGHGHAGANQVIWNSTATSSTGFIVQSPIGAQNWMIGSVGTTGAGGGVGFHTPGLIDSQGANVTPRSLYYAQQAERMAVSNFVLREVRLGDSDLLTNDGAVDNVNVDPTWKTNIQTATGKTGVGFDVVANGQLVPFTFNLNLDPGTFVVNASLSLGLKSAGGATSGDRIFIEDKSRSYSWSDLGIAPPTTTQDGVVFDLSKLLPALQDGKLNIAILGNSAVDWATLNFQTGSTRVAMTTTLTAVADAQVNSASPSSNFGTGTTFQTKNDSSNGSLESYLKFDLSSVNGYISSATIRLMPTGVTYNNPSSGYHALASAFQEIGAFFNQVSLVSDDSWTETGINWNNRPAADPAMDTFLAYQNAPLNIDVTALVRAAQAGDKTLSLKLQSIINLADATHGQTTYGARENSNSTLRPQLILQTYSSLSPVADSYVRSGANAGLNFGSTPDLQIKKDSSATSDNNREAYLKFDLSSLSSPLAAVQVQLVPFSADTTVTNSLGLVSDNTWTEGGITWNNKPVSGGVLGTWTPQPFVPAVVDATSSANASLGGDKLLSLRLFSNVVATNITSYGSRENSDPGLRPVLTLTNQKPAITSLLDLSSSVNQATAPTWFGVWDAETAPGSLVVSATSSNTTLLPTANIVLSGTGLDRSFVLTPAAGQSGFSNVTVTVTDAQGQTASAVFKLTVVNGTVINGDQDAPNENDVFRVVRNGSFLDVYRNDMVTPVLHADYSSLSLLLINGLGGDDTFTLDYTGGNPVPAAGLNLDGGSGNDLVSVVTTAGADSVTLSAAGISANGSGSAAYPNVEQLDLAMGAGSDTLAATGNGSVTAGIFNLNISGGGTVLVVAGSTLPNFTDVNVNGATFDVNGQNVAIDALNGSGTVTNNGSAAATLTVGSGGGSGLFSGVLSNGSQILSMTKAGAGTQTLSGANTYTGLTTISGGVLASGNSASLVGLAGTIMFNGGTLHITANSAANNVVNKFNTNSGFAGTGGTIDVDAGVTLTIGTAGGLASLRTNGGGFHGGTFTKTGAGTLRILSNNGQLDDPFKLSGGTVIVESATALGGADNSSNHVDMKSGTTLVLRQDASTNFLTPISIVDAAATVNVIIDRQNVGSGPAHLLNAVTSVGAFTLNLSTGSNVSNGTSSLTLGSVTLGGDGNFNVGANTSLTVTGAVAGAFSLAKSGPGLLTLNGTDTYGGATSAQNGTLKLGSAAALPVTTNVTLGTGTDAATLDLSGFSVSVNSLTANGNNASGNSVINLNPGQTLSITGATAGGNAILVGGLTGTDNVITKLTFSGGGNLSVTSSGDILVDNDAVAISSTHVATLDVTGLASFTANIDELLVGVSPTNQPRARGVLNLAASNNITANSMTIGRTAGNAAGGTQLNLGQTTTLSANTITLATGKGNSASIQFRSGLNNPTASITDKNTGIGADLRVGFKSNAGTADPLGTADFSAGTINATLNELVVGWNSDAQNTATGVFTMNAGTVTVRSLTIGRSTVAGGTANGTLNTSGGSLTVSTAAILGSQTNGIAGGTLNATGGIVSLGIDLADGGGTSSLNLSGGSLDMTGYAIGGANPINNLTFTSGTLSNVAEINAGSGSLTKTGAGTLIVNGVNTYTGATNINAGTLRVNGSIATSSGVTVNSGGNLVAGVTQSLNALTIHSGGSGSVVSGGDKVLTVAALTIDGGGTLDLTDEDMVIDYAASSPVQDVRQMLFSGRLISSLSTATTRLGYGDNAVLGRSTFSGQAVDATSVLVKYTYAGDADLDGDADGVDIGIWATKFTGEQGGTGTNVWTDGDWDYDGDVDGVDAGLWAQAFTGEQGGGGLSQPPMPIKSPAPVQKARTPTAVRAPIIAI